MPSKPNIENPRYEIGEEIYGRKILKFVIKLGKVLYYRTKCLKCGEEKVLSSTNIRQKRKCRTCYRKTAPFYNYKTPKSSRKSDA